MQVQRVNYQKQLEQYIAGMHARQALALHSCCAPCSSAVLEYLTQYFDVTLFYYNPNIFPRQEYEKRLREQLALCERLYVPAVACDYEPQDFFDTVRGQENEPEGGARCTRCFALRLSYTAGCAARQGIGLLTTTLTVSPHKDAQRINQIGMQAAQEHGIQWLCSDFKKNNGYARSIVLSKEYGLYRQDYCGCIFSAREREKIRSKKQKESEVE